MDLYDFYGRKISWYETGSNKSKVFYVKCVCGHLAIRKNRSTKALFRCSLCKREYSLILSGKVKLI